MNEDPRVIGPISILINSVLKEQPQLFDAFMIVRRLNQLITFDKWLELNHKYALQYKRERPDADFGLLMSYVQKEVGTKFDISLVEYLENPHVILQWITKIQPKKPQITLREYLADPNMYNLYILSLSYKHNDIEFFRNELKKGWSYVSAREQPVILANLLEANLSDLVKVFNPNAYSKFRSPKNDLVIVDQVGCIKNDTVTNPLNKSALCIVRVLKNPDQSNMLSTLHALNSDVKLKYTEYCPKVVQTKAFEATPTYNKLQKPLNKFRPLKVLITFTRLNLNTSKSTACFPRPVNHIPPMVRPLIYQCPDKCNDSEF
jgi:hypothetical protein